MGKEGGSWGLVVTTGAVSLESRAWRRSLQNAMRKVRGGAAGSAAACGGPLPIGGAYGLGERRGWRALGLPDADVALGAGWVCLGCGRLGAGCCCLGSRSLSGWNVKGGCAGLDRWSRVGVLPPAGPPARGALLALGAGPSHLEGGASAGCWQAGTVFLVLNWDFVSPANGPENAPWGATGLWECHALVGPRRAKGWTFPACCFRACVPACLHRSSVGAPTPSPGWANKSGRGPRVAATHKCGQGWIALGRRRGPARTGPWDWQQTNKASWARRRAAAAVRRPRRGRFRGRASAAIWGKRAVFGGGPMAALTQRRPGPAAPGGARRTPRGPGAPGCHPARRPPAGPAGRVGSGWC
jgi:hypothetical protein